MHEFFHFYLFIFPGFTICIQNKKQGHNNSIKIMDFFFPVINKNSAEFLLYF